MLLLLSIIETLVTRLKSISSNEYIDFSILFIFTEKMSNSTASSVTPTLTEPLTLRVIDAQTSTENARKFTKYKVSVNYNGQEWEIWRRYKEFHTLNEKVK